MATAKSTISTYAVTLHGDSPLLLHADDLSWRGQMERWVADPENKRNSKAGDDRTPAWRWLGCCYHDGKRIGLPSDNLMTALREGGAKVPVPGKKNLTYKRQSQSGLVVNEMLWPLQTSKGEVPWGTIAPLVSEANFDKHEETARASGFELFVKPVKVGMSKHVRVRPRFNAWSASGTITVFDESITADVLQSILDMAGTYCGLGDWRPSAPSKPGPWGRFRAEITRS
jgi:hypothetical protein